MFVAPFRIAQGFYSFKSQGLGESVRRFVSDVHLCIQRFDPMRIARMPYNSGYSLSREPAALLLYVYTVREVRGVFKREERQLCASGEPPAMPLAA